MSMTADGVTITDAALAQLVVHAAEQVVGARVRRRRIEVQDDAVTLALGAQYGVVLPELARDVQRCIADAFRAMCGKELRAVDLTVEELL